MKKIQNIKKIIGIIAVLIFNQTYSDSNCYAYPSQPRFQQAALEKTHCDCECFKYPHTKNSFSKYICINCQHQRTPTNIRHLFVKRTSRKQSAQNKNQTPT